ncbi:MAG: hypothetical protein JST12_14960 [Armatimonadetes bacterium]|nr:hypothetical protein [Armatimonadota bacterium]
MKIADLKGEGVLTESQVKLITDLAKSKGEASVARPTELSVEKLWSLAPPSVEIITEVLDGVDKSPGKTTLLERWMARIGKVLWLFVEATVPRKPFYLALRYWFQILFTLTTVMVVLTYFKIWEPAKDVAVKVELVLVGIYVLTETVRGIIARRFDVILTTAGTSSLVIGLILLGYMAAVNDINLLSLGTDQSRFTWTLFGLLCVPTIFAIAAWSYRKSKSAWRVGLLLVVLGLAPVVVEGVFYGFKGLYSWLAWVAFAMLCVPSLVGLMFRDRAYVRGAALRSGSWWTGPWDFAKRSLTGVAVFLYAGSVVGSGAYLYLNPRPQEKKTTVVKTSNNKFNFGLSEESEPEVREQSTAEIIIKNKVDGVWKRLGWNGENDAK